MDEDALTLALRDAADDGSARTGRRQVCSALTTGFERLGDTLRVWSGRGMLITDALAGRWGARLAGVGKVVWFEVWAGDPRRGGADVGSGGYVG